MAFRHQAHGEVHQPSDGPNEPVWLRQWLRGVTMPMTWLGKPFGVMRYVPIANAP
jgi:hypothetical protein